MNTFGLIDGTGKIINLVKSAQESDIINPDNYTIVDLTGQLKIGAGEYWDSSTSTIIDAPDVISSSTLPSTGSTTVNIHLAYDRNISALGTLDITTPNGKEITEWSISNQTLTDSGSIFDVVKTSDPFENGVDVWITPESITDTDGRIYPGTPREMVLLMHNYSI